MYLSSSNIMLEIIIFQFETCLMSRMQQKKARISPDDRKSSVLPGLLVQPADTENRQCFFHFTVATDTGNIKTVFENVHTLIIEHNLKTVGVQ